MRIRRNIERGNKVVGQIRDVATQMPIQPPGVILDRVVLVHAVGGAFLARVGVRERRLDTVRGIVGEGKRNGAGGGNGEQMRIADAVFTDRLSQRLRQT